MQVSCHHCTVFAVVPLSKDNVIGGDLVMVNNAVTVQAVKHLLAK